MKWIDRTYMGQERLWKVFWLGYIAPLLPLTIALGIFKETAASLSWWTAFAFFITLFLYQVWLAVAMWRCSPNVRHRAFFYLGRVFAAFVGLTALLALESILKRY